VLTTKGFTPGDTGNHQGGTVSGSQVQVAKTDDLGAQAVSKDLGGLPVTEDASVPPGTVRVVLTADYTGPGSGLDGRDATLDAESATTGAASTSTDTGEAPPPPSPILTAGSDDPACVN
jgi:hypothetical protein